MLEGSGNLEGLVQGRGADGWHRPVCELPESILDLVGRDPSLCMDDGLHGERASDGSHLLLAGGLLRAGVSCCELLWAGVSWCELL